MAKKKRPEPPVSFGGLFKGLGNLIDLVTKLAEEGKELKKEFKGVTPTGKEFKGVYGFSIRSLAGGKPTVETFGNIVKETPKGPIVEEVREPMVDVFDEKDHIRVIAELPGVSKEDIGFEVKDDILSISAQTKERKYSKEVLLPCVVDAKAVTSSYKNGILEVKLQKGKKK